MVLALPVWRDRISPVLDTATRLLVIRWENGQATDLQELPLMGVSMHQRAAQFAGQQIELLLCGAVSRALHDMLQATGIKVVPFLSGEVQAILEAYRDGRLAEPQFKMPGCCRRRGRRRGTGLDQGRGRRRRCGPDEDHGGGHSSDRALKGKDVS